MEPAAMRPEERIVEIAEIFAHGYARLCIVHRAVHVAQSGERHGQATPDVHESGASESNPLAVARKHEPSCDHAVKTREKEKVA